ncbi:uncharacterized protein LOC135488354 [Lineus longissimus]|uniref:uncharacterized protein LOC135488354 n=1 Tax=Lineus longissimus TaxID=88925 RepID=UPI002B4E6583
MGAGCSSERPDFVAEPKVPSFKIVLVGQPEAGKTSVFNRFLKNQFDYSYRPTVDVCIESSVRKVNIPENNVVAVTIWDLPGRDDVDLRKTYYRDLDAAVVVVDIADRESVELAASWKQEVVNNATVTKTKREVDADGQPRVTVTHIPAEQGTIPILLLGNKLDVVEEQFMKDKVEALAKKAQEKVEEVQVETIDKPFDEQIYSWELDSLPDTYRNKQKDIEMDSLIDLRARKEMRTPMKADDKLEETQVLEDDTPEMVKQFQEIGEEHGFISSCPVAAKFNDGSVGLAMTSLIRHLLEKHLGKASPKKCEKATVVKVHKKKKGEKDPIKLDPVGVEQLDELYQRCYLPMKMNYNFTKNYKFLLKEFRIACVEAQLVDGKECTLSSCVTGIKEEIEGDYELKIEDDGYFLTISAEKKRELADDLEEDMAKCVETLQKFCDVCRAIAREVPGAKSFLTKLDNMLEDRAEDAADRWKAEGRPNQELKTFGKAVENHNAEIDSSIHHMEENLTTVINTKEKIKNALMW